MNDTFCKWSLWILNGLMLITIGYLFVQEEIMFGINAVFLFLVANIPYMLNKKYKLPFPLQLHLYWALMVSAQLLLASFKVYKNPTFWYVDELGHFFGSMVFATIGFFILLALDDYQQHKLSLVFMAIFAFTFAMTAEVVWEIIEFVIDILFNLGAQGGYIVVDGVIVWDEVNDTMRDLILDLFGAGLISIGLVYWARAKTKAQLEKYIAPIRQYLG